MQKKDTYEEIYTILGHNFFVLRLNERRRKKNEVIEFLIEDNLKNNILELCNKTLVLIDKTQYSSFNELVKYCEEHNLAIIQGMLNINKENSDESFHFNTIGCFYVFYKIVEKVQKFVDLEWTGNIFPIYNTLSDLIIHYQALITKYALQKGIHSKIGTFANHSNEQFSICLAINNLLYDGISQPSPLVKYTSVFLIRAYIENLVRTNFKQVANSKGIDLGRVLHILWNKKVKESILGLQHGDHIYEYCKSLSTINEWTNKFIHTSITPPIWQPFYVKMYIDKFSEILGDNSIEYEKTITLQPKLIPLDSDAYKEIKKLLDKELNKRKRPINRI